MSFYKAQAEAALAEVEKMTAEARSLDANTQLSIDEKRTKIEALNGEIATKLAEARDATEALEREAEVRSLGGAWGGPAFRGESGVLTEPGDEKRFADGSWLSNEIRTVTGADGLGAAVTPAENARMYFDRLAPRSAFLRSGVQIIKTDADSVVVPRLTADPAAAWVAEGGTITPTDPNADTITATPRKLAILTDITNEAVADSRPKVLELHASSIFRSAGNAFDLACFEGSGTAPQIRGLKNVAGIQTLSMGTNGAALANLDPIVDALSMLDAANADSSKAAIVMPVRTWQGLMKLKEQATGNNKPLLSESAAAPNGVIERRLFGVPVFLSSQLSLTETQGTSNAASSIYVYDVSQQFAVFRQEANVFLDPYSKSDQDITRVRLTMRADMVSANPASVVRITGVL